MDKNSLIIIIIEKMLESTQIYNFLSLFLLNIYFIIIYPFPIESYKEI